MSKDDEYIAEMEAEIDRLRALNAEMLAALEGVVEAERMQACDRVVSETKFNRAWAAVHALIAKAGAGE